MALDHKATLPDTLKAFHERIEAMEASVYEATSENRGNLGAKVHRVQFGILNTDTNWKVRDRLLPAASVKNPKFIVFVSEMNMVAVGNNLGGLTRRHRQPRRRRHAQRV